MSSSVPSPTSSAPSSAEASAAAAAAGYIPLVLNLDLLIGAPLIGLVFAGILSGVLALQVFNYYRLFPNDRVGIKVLVAVLCCLDFAHLGCISHYVYYITVTYWGKIFGLIILPVTYGLQIILTSCITALVQAFLLYRVYVLSLHRWPIVIALGLVSLGALASGGALGAVVLGAGPAPPIQFVERLGTAWSSLTATSDLLIALCLVYLLWSLKTPMSSRRIDRLIIFIINTGLLTAVFAFIDLALLKRFPFNQITTLFSFPLGRIYSNSMLASLNSRAAEADGKSASENTAGSTVITFSHAPAAARQRRPPAESFQLAPMSVMHGSEGVADEDGYPFSGAKEAQYSADFIHAV